MERADCVKMKYKTRERDSLEIISSRFLWKMLSVGLARSNTAQSVQQTIPQKINAIAL